MSQSNALDRLVSKKKPVVSPRGDVVNESVSLDVKTARQQNGETSVSDGDNKDNSTHDSQTSLSQDIQTGLTVDDFETVRNTIRIDSTIDEPLRRLCHDERITKETWLEAAYLYLSDHPDELAGVVRVARERLEQRKAIADYKRAKTMQERFLKS
jgi:hypothetical protein